MLQNNPKHARKFLFIRKLRAILTQYQSFLLAVRFGQLSRRCDTPWIYYCNKNEHLISEEGKKGVLCDWQWPSTLLGPIVFPSIGIKLLKEAVKDWPIKFMPAPPLKKDNIELSFIIGHKGLERYPNLMTTLQSLAAQKDVTLECIVVEQSVIPEIRDMLPKWVKYIHTSLPDPKLLYSRSWAFNVGARAAQGHLLVFYDNDLCAPVDYGKELLQLREQGYKAMRLQRFIIYLDEDTSKCLRQNRRMPEIVKPELILQNCVGGTIAVDRKIFFQIGGYDESFIGWGGEDDEFFQRCQRAKIYMYAYLPFIHLYHHQQQDAHQGSNLKFLETRAKISTSARIEELAKRDFGNLKQPAPFLHRIL